MLFESAWESRSALGKGSVGVAAGGALRQVLQGIVGVLPIHPKAKYWTILVTRYRHLHIAQEPEYLVSNGTPK